MTPLQHKSQSIKYYSLAALLVFLLLAAGACYVSSTPAPDIEATVQAAVQATLDARPTDTPAPDMQATMMATVKATLIVQPANASTSALEKARTADRPYRS